MNFKEYISVPFKLRMLIKKILKWIQPILSKVQIFNGEQRIKMNKGQPWVNFPRSKHFSNAGLDDIYSGQQ